MTGSVWIYTAVIGLAVTQLVAFWYLYRQSDLSTSAGATAQTHPDRGTRTTGDADHVQCPDCGAPNESTFRYCRNCVSELPRRVTVDRETGTTQGRGDAATRTDEAAGVPPVDEGAIRLEMVIVESTRVTVRASNERLWPTMDTSSRGVGSRYRSRGRPGRGR